jgi:hypothetical protein
MQNDIDIAPSQLPDAELIARVKTLVSRERRTTAQLIAHLAELDARGLHLAAGYASLFVYCRDALRHSEHEAYLRIEAARASRRFPLILDLLAIGDVNLTTVKLLAPHLTAENHRQVLESARGRRKSEVEELAARLAPRPDVPARVRKLPASAPPATTPCQRPIPTPDVTPPPPAQVSAPPSATSIPSRPVVTTPLAPDRYRLQLTIGGETLAKLRLAQELLSHAIPSGDDAAILDRALTALLTELARKRFAATEKPRPGRPTAEGSRHIPAEVKRAVWLRDLGRCAFVGTSGRRCEERRFLEFHHLKPFAIGGEATVAGLSIRCRAHNGHEAKLFFARDESDGAGVVREADTSYLAGTAAGSPDQHQLGPERVPGPTTHGATSDPALTLRTTA